MIDPAIRQIQRIEDMPKESFVLYGDSSKPGLYLQYQRRAPNNWSTPHYHPIDRVVMVMGGTMRIGTGATGDKTRRWRCRRADSSTISLAVSTTTGPGTIRCGFSPQVSGRRRLSMSTRRNSPARPRNSGADVQECRQQHLRLRRNVPFVGRPTTQADHVLSQCSVEPT